MKSLQMTDFGDIEDVTELVEKETPSPKANEALLELIASPIHPSNTFLISGDYPQKVDFPHIMGTEGIAKVVDTGGEVDELNPGDTVLLPPGTPSWQSHVTVLASKLVPIPVDDKEIQFQLAMSSINPPTAYLLLHNFVDLQEGDWIVQNAANSSVGRYIIQLAAELSVKSINLVRREELREELEEIGANAVLVDNDTVHKKVREIVGNGKVRLGIDAVAGEASNRLLKCMSRDSTLVVYGSMSKKPMALNVGTMLQKRPSVKSFWLSTWYQESKPEEIITLLKKLAGLIAKGKLHTKIAKTFSLDNYVEALNYAQKDAKGGKVLFTK